jgi:hypothetical protein
MGVGLPNENVTSICIVACTRNKFANKSNRMSCVGNFEEMKCRLRWNYSIAFIGPNLSHKLNANERQIAKTPKHITKVQFLATYQNARHFALKRN